MVEMSSYSRQTASTSAKVACLRVHACMQGSDEVKESCMKRGGSES